jgi:hypothetical protein
VELRSVTRSRLRVAGHAVVRPRSLGSSIGSHGRIHSSSRLQVPKCQDILERFEQWIFYTIHVDALCLVCAVTEALAGCSDGISHTFGETAISRPSPTGRSSVGNTESKWYWASSIRFSRKYEIQRLGKVACIV